MHYDASDMDSYQILTPGDMRKTEEKAFALGVPSLLLMEHAAMAVVDALADKLGGCCKGKKVLFLCGTGNNGGDGLAAARLFVMRGGMAEIWLSGDVKTPDAKANLAWCKALDIKMLNLREMPLEEWPLKGEGPREHFDGYVDALLGTGIKGVPDEVTTRMILVPWHDFSFPPVIAVDVPSGLNGLTGEVFEDSYVRADVTVTFHAPKPGLYLTKVREAVGKIIVADIGLWKMGPWYSDALLLENAELNCEVLTEKALRFLPGRTLHAHKGDCGRVLIYAGSMGMAGAAAMCAKAAIAAGAGLTTIACSRDVMPVLQTLVPNAMCVDIEKAVREKPAFDVMVMGCGLGQGEDVWQNIKALYDPQKSTVWDADALNLLAKNPFVLGEKAVITPHIGEAARLLGCSAEEVLKDRLKAAKELCEKFGCTVVVKSDVTAICRMEDGKTEYVLNAAGSPAMAKGGSGDVLAGMLGTLLHQADSAFRAAGLACLWHGMAGETGEKKYGLLELTSEQLIDCLYEARKNV